MVAVPRSNGCLTCRARRIKCDEGAPVCKRCLDSGRECAYRDKFTFVSGASKQTKPGAVPDAADRSVAKPMRKSVWLYATEKRTDSGGLYQKWHRSDAMPACADAVSAGSDAVPTLTNGVALAPAEKRALMLMACFEHGHIGTHMTILGQWLTWIPQRLGASTALDEAACLMASVHSAMIRNQNPHTWMDPTLYHRAIQSLRVALADPVEGYSVETLATTFMLYFLESMIGSPYSWNFIYHAGGAARLLEVRGPPNRVDDLEMLMALQLRGAMVARCVVLGTPCFLAAPAWIDYFDTYAPHSEDLGMFYKMMKAMTSWPDFTCKIRELRANQLPYMESQALLQQLYHAKTQLDSLEPFLQANLADGSVASLVKPTRKDSLFRNVYYFHEYKMLSLYTYHACFTLIINRMIRVVGSALLQDLHLEYTTAVDEYSDALTTRIMQFFEDAWRRRPLGVQMMSVPLTMAFQHAGTETSRQWILQALHELDEHRKLDKPRFTMVAMEVLAKMYTGETDPALPPPQG